MVISRGYSSSKGRVAQPCLPGGFNTIVFTSSSRPKALGRRARMRSKIRQHPD